MGRDAGKRQILLIQVTVVSVVVRSFLRQKTKQTEVGEATQPSRRQNKNMERWDVSEAGNLKLDFMAKSIGINFFGFEYIFRYYSDKKTKNPVGRVNTFMLHIFH